jgi:hypothetical protein
MKNKILCAGSTNEVFVALAELQEVHSAYMHTALEYEEPQDDFAQKLCGFSKIQDSGLSLYQSPSVLRCICLSGYPYSWY